MDRKELAVKADLTYVEEEMSMGRCRLQTFHVGGQSIVWLGRQINMTIMVDVCHIY